MLQEGITAIRVKSAQEGDESQEVIRDRLLPSCRILLPPNTHHYHTAKHPLVAESNGKKPATQTRGLQVQHRRAKREGIRS